VGTEVVGKIKRKECRWNYYLGNIPAAKGDYFWKNTGVAYAQEREGSGLFPGPNHGGRFAKKLRRDLWGVVKAQSPPGGEGENGWGEILPISRGGKISPKTPRKRWAPQVRRRGELYKHFS